MPEETQPQPQPAQDKPRLRAADVRYNIHLAGARAGAAAREGAYDGGDAAALVGAAAGGATFGGIDFPPITLGALAGVRKLGALMGERASASEIQMMLWICARPAAAWRRLRGATAADIPAIEDEATEMAFDMPLPALREAQAWINAELERLSARGADTGDAEKKPSAPEAVGQPEPTPAPPPSEAADTEVRESHGR